MTKRHWVVVGIGLTVAVVGVIIGAVVAVKVDGISCGAPWGSGNPAAGLFPGFAEECADASESSKITAWVLTIGGLLVAAVGALAGYLRPARDTRVIR